VPETKRIDPHRVAKIVGSYVKHNKIAADDLPNLIATVYQSLAELGQPAEAPASLKPAVAINRSYGRDFVVCLDCGWRGQLLRRHLTAAHGSSASDYRSKWGLRDNHPLSSLDYTARRTEIALRLGLGRTRQPDETSPVSTAPPTTPPASQVDTAFMESLSRPKRRGRPRSQALPLT